MRCVCYFIELVCLVFSSHDLDNGASPCARLDCTLRKIMSLIRKVNIDTKQKRTLFSFSTVYPAKVGEVSSKTIAHSEKSVLSQGFLIFAGANSTVTINWEVFMPI